MTVIRPRWILIVVLIVSGSSLMAETFTEALVAARKADEDIMVNLYGQVDQLTRAYPVEVDWLTQTQQRPGMDRGGRPIGVLRYLEPEKAPDFMAPATLAAIQE